MRLQIIMTSTREGRQGMPVAQWFLERAKAHGQFDIELIDLKEVALPLFDEPEHPSHRNYRHPHTKAWSARIQQGDAYVFVIPEYNHMLPPAMLNAVDYLVHEWAYKPAAFVSYGGVSGGTRSAESAIPLLTGLKVMPIPEAVNIPFFAKAIHDGKLDAAIQEKAAMKVLDELKRWANALKPLRGT